MRKLQACDHASAEFKVTRDHMLLCPAGVFYRHFTIGLGLSQATPSSPLSVKLPILPPASGWNCTESNDAAPQARDYVAPLCWGAHCTRQHQRFACQLTSLSEFLMAEASDEIVWPGTCERLLVQATTASWPSAIRRSKPCVQQGRDSPCIKSMNC